MPLVTLGFWSPLCAGPSGNGAASTPPPRRPTAQDFQIRVGMERVRVPEIVFQPAMVGIDQVRQRHTLHPLKTLSLERKHNALALSGGRTLLVKALGVIVP